MPGCAVYGCNNYSRKTKGSDIKYYSFPKNYDIAKQWINACYRQDKFNVQQARICSKHFSPNSFVTSLKCELLNYTPLKHRNLKSDAIPTESLPNTTSSNSSPKHRNETACIRKQKKKQRDIINRILEESITERDCLDNIDEKIKSDITQRSYNYAPNSALNQGESSEDIESLKAKILLLQTENETLKVQNQTLEHKNQSLSKELNRIKILLKNHIASKLRSVVQKLTDTLGR